ncbi:uncharacterized protein N7515_005288 [Penicillium bovifimosum]|uniref:Uncharacterized protein n=1 Tax=Penicillium bovifimosum TaxID=126998 RepID=A0A9W9GU25_9EURO|nr:uncharacterized protein N7515_005288 [Penicillium bovifimosum]KAJ5129249.1 hypothetical protein N7515_005288 [Penicillium bovifimosum]
MQYSVFQDDEPLLELPNEDAVWVTVMLHEEMEDSHTDEEIFKHVHHQIKIRRAGVGRQALHNLGKVCISIPIQTGSTDTRAILALAEADAYKWIGILYDGVVTLNRTIIFSTIPSPAPEELEDYDETEEYAKAQELWTK